VEFPDASEENMLLILPNTPDDVEFPDASVVGFPDASDEEENMLLMLSNIPPDASVTGFPDASVESEEEKRLNGSLFDENIALIEVVPFKNDVII